MSTEAKTALVIGASRSLGLALVAELSDRGWSVVGTVRGSTRTGLHELAVESEGRTSEGRVEVETADLADRESLTALRSRLDGKSFDLLFVNGAITRGDVPAGRVPTETFVEVMVTNALGPLVAIEVLGDLVPPTGAIAVMSSSQGSISLNTWGHHDVYRASKSALNQQMRCLAAQMSDDPRTLLLINPGHVQTELGGPGAPLTIQDSVPAVVDTITAHATDGGLQFLDRHGATVPW